MKEIKLGMIVSFEPMDRFEWGVVYELDDDGHGGLAAFIDGCSDFETLMLRHVSIDGDCVVVRNHRDAKLREAVVRDYEPNNDWYAMSLEQSLAGVMKILSMTPQEIDIWLDPSAFKNDWEWTMRREKSRLRKAIYKMLASDECEWLRRLWPKLSSSWEEEYKRKSAGVTSR